MTMTMIRGRWVLASLLAVALVAFAPLSVVQANDAALAEIDHIVHEWEDGDLTAEEALEEIDHIIHELPAAERVGVLAEIDHIVHEWEDGDLTAEEAMEMIEELVHAALAHGGDDHDAAPGPAASGNAGLMSTGAGSMLLLGLVALTGAVLVGARATVGRVRVR